MEEQKVVVEQVVVTKPEGKGMAVAGFILALVTMLFNTVIFGVAVAMIALGGSGWLMYFWLVLNILSIVLCAMAMGKLKRTGGKRGLAIAGLVIGLVGTVWAIFLTLGTAAGDANKDEIRTEFNKELNNMNNNM